VPAGEEAGEPVAVPALVVVAAAVATVVDSSAASVTLAAAVVVSAAAIVRPSAVPNVVLFVVPIVVRTERWARRRIRKIPERQKCSNADSSFVGSFAVWRSFDETTVVAEYFEKSTETLGLSESRERQAKKQRRARMPFPEHFQVPPPIRKSCRYPESAPAWTIRIP